MSPRAIRGAMDWRRGFEQGRGALKGSLRNDESTAAKKSFRVGAPAASEKSESNSYPLMMS
jgi:hypothetical protein